MKSLADFEKTLQENEPRPELPDLLRALWWDAKEEWDKAHDIAQDIHTAEGSWIHAYLHRKEGDQFNAGYWYRRAGREPFEGTLENEWEEMAGTFLKQQN